MAKADRTAGAQLSDEQIDRYARQIIVPGIDAAGQATLLAAAVRVLGCPRGRRVSERYLEAAGVRVATPDQAADCVLVAGALPWHPSVRGVIAQADAPVVWYTIRGDTIRGGILRSGAAEPAAGAEDSTVEDGTDASYVLHAAAACDAAAAAVAVVLGWDDVQASFEVKLA